MKKLTNELDKCRITSGPFKSDPSYGITGAYMIFLSSGRWVGVICDEGPDTGWEHVSVSLENRLKTPSWAEMCEVKDMFWDKEETVIQFHPPESKKVNNHPGCLHMWKQTNKEIELPPEILVGIKSKTIDEPERKEQ